MKTTKKPSSSRYHHGDLRQAIIDASVQVIQERGEVTFSVREIAMAVGVSHAAVYKHFANKRAVLAAVAEEGFGLLLAEVGKTKASANPVDIVRKQAELYVGFAMTHIGHFRAMYSGELADKSDYPLLAELYVEAGEVLTRNFTAGLQDGLFKKAKPESLTMALWAAVHGLVDLSLQGQLPDVKIQNKAAVQRSAKKIVELLLHGLLA